MDKSLSQKEDEPTEPEPINEIDEYLKEIYTNPENEAGFASAGRLYHAAKEELPAISLHDVKEFLKTQNSYTIHKQARHRFPRGKVISNGLNAQYDIDLADVSNIASQNDGMNFLIVMIDVFSRFAYAEPIKRKAAVNVIEGMKRIFARMPKLPLSVRHDLGTEFTSSQFKKLMSDNNIKDYGTTSSMKANFSERMIKTLKERLYRYMTNQSDVEHKPVTRYIDILQDTMNAYNHSVHSSTQMRPADVTEANESELWKKLYLHNKSIPLKMKRQRLKLNQQVRIALKKGPLTKGYTGNWSKEIYIIKGFMTRNGLPMYVLTDLNGGPVTQTYYAEELQPVLVSAQRQIELVRATRGRGDKKEYLVRWKHYGPSFDEYVFYFHSKLL